MVVVVVVVVVILVVGVLAFAGVFTPSSSTGQGLTGTPVSYDQVSSAGANAVQNESGGPWRLVAAVGLGLATSASGSIAANAVVSGCTATPAPGSPSGGTLPATPTGSPAGSVALWMFIAANSPGDILIIAVTQNATVPLFILSGSCTSEFSDLGSIAGLSVVNSPLIANTTNSAGGSAFLTSHPGTLQTFILFGPGIPHAPDMPIWGAEYNTCGLASTGTGTLFIALYDASSGSPYGSPMTQSTNC
ncbi:MAG TPA: hypothetical protein VK424_08470 [Thermoplasmata archaeon]|nr:hypothetical protein [Thermoplasmata archaeon]